MNTNAENSDIVMCWVSKNPDVIGKFWLQIPIQRPKITQNQVKYTFFIRTIL